MPRFFIYLFHHFKMITQVRQDTLHRNADDYLQRGRSVANTLMNHYLLREDYGDFFIVPVFITRDSNCLEESNYRCAKEAIWKESSHGETTELSFGHWGYGWFNMMVVHPDDVPGVATAVKIACALEDYPVLNEEDYSSQEHDAAQEY